MLGTPLIIDITRKTDEIDASHEYVNEDVYLEISANMIEVSNKDFSTNISQTQPVQKYAFMIDKDKVNVKIGDIISYTGPFGDVNMKVTVPPKHIEFEDDENFIKLTAEWVGM